MDGGLGVTASAQGRIGGKIGDRRFPLPCGPRTSFWSPATPWWFDVDLPASL